MTQDKKTPQDEQQLSDDALDAVSGGPVYIKIDGIKTQKLGDGSVKPTIVDGTSNTIR